MCAAANAGSPAPAVQRDLARDRRRNWRFAPPISAQPLQPPPRKKRRSDANCPLWRPPSGPVIRSAVREHLARRGFDPLSPLRAAAPPFAVVVPGHGQSVGSARLFAEHAPEWPAAASLLDSTAAWSPRAQRPASALSAARTSSPFAECAAPDSQRSAGPCGRSLQSGASRPERSATLTRSCLECSAARALSTGAHGGATRPHHRGSIPASLDPR